MSTTQPKAKRLAEHLDAVPETGADPDLIQESAAELRRLHEVEEQRAELMAALKLAVRQNEHDMLMTGDELRDARAAIAKATGEQA